MSKVEHGITITSSPSGAISHLTIEQCLEDNPSCRAFAGPLLSDPSLFSPGRKSEPNKPGLRVDPGAVEDQLRLMRKTPEPFSEENPFDPYGL